MREVPVGRESIGSAKNGVAEAIRTGTRSEKRVCHGAVRIVDHRNRLIGRRRLNVRGQRNRPIGIQDHVGAAHVFRELASARRSDCRCRNASIGYECVGRRGI